MRQRYLYIIKQAPYGSAAGVEALDAAIMSANFEIQVSLLFIHDGVFQLKRGQGDELKNTGKIYKALSDFDINSIYVDQLSLDARGLSPSDLVVSAQALQPDQVKASIASYHRVLVF